MAREPRRGRRAAGGRAAGLAAPPWRGCGSGEPREHLRLEPLGQGRVRLRLGVTLLERDLKECERIYRILAQKIDQYLNS